MDLVGRAAIAMRDMEKSFHVTDLEIRDSPCANLAGRNELFKLGHYGGEIGDPIWPMQQIQLEVVSRKAGEARVAGLFDAAPCHMTWPDLGDEKYAVAPPGNDTRDPSFGVAVAIYLG